MGQGDILGHEPMGIVQEVGSEVTEVSVGDRVVIPFQISCGHCFMCERHLYTQCETTQVRAHGMGAALFGFSKLYGQVPGGQAEYLRVPQVQNTHIKVPDGPPDDRFVYLSDVLPTAWQSVVYADVPQGGTLVVLGLGPIGDMACRIAHHQGFRVIGVDLVRERLARVRQRGIEVVDLAGGGARNSGVLRPPVARCLRSAPPADGPGRPRSGRRGRSRAARTPDRSPRSPRPGPLSRRRSP